MVDKATTPSYSLIKLHTGREIPQIGLGTYQMRGQECTDAVKIAIKAGYRHIDTASVYRNEVDIAAALNELYQQKVVTREELYITSKIAPGEQGYDKALSACEAILSKLQTPYLDLLLIHWPGVGGLSPDSDQIPGIRLETWKALEKLQKDGKVRDIGVSNFLVHHLEHLKANSETKPVINQFEIHPVCYNKELVDYCEKENIIVEAYSSLARNEDVLMKDKKVLELAEKYGKTPAQIALKWGIQKNFVILPKSRTEERILTNFRLSDFELSGEEVQQLTDLNKNHHTCWDPVVVKH